MERPWNSKETAAALGIPEATLRYYVHKKVAPKSFKIGGRRVWLPSDVEAWLKAQYEATASEAS